MKLVKRIFFALFKYSLAITISCILQGCRTEVEQVRRPTAETNDQQSNFSLNLEANYRSQKYSLVIKDAENFLIKNPEAWDVRFLLGLAFFNFGDHEKAATVFDQIPTDVRVGMLDSCLELQAAKAINNTSALIKISKIYFPDCLEDLQTKNSSTDKAELSSELIMKYGKLYDEAVSRNDEPEIRRLKELDFMKKHKLDEKVLNEITSRYLEILADDSGVSD